MANDRKNRQSKKLCPKITDTMMMNDVLSIASNLHQYNGLGYGTYMTNL